MTESKYIKYKAKYLKLIKSMSGGSVPEHIHKIAGPCTLAYYNIHLTEGLTKKILVLGENHVPDGEPCGEKSCIHIIDFLTELSKEECIDFFLEFSPRKTEGYAMYGGDNLMIKLRRFALKLQERNNVRVQKWDLRSFTKSDGMSNGLLQGHKILIINIASAQFLNRYGESYIGNIKDIHAYLYGLEDSNNIRHMISMMSIHNIMEGEYEFTSDSILADIMRIHEDISVKFNQSEYIQLLKFIIPILMQIKSNEVLKLDIDYVIEADFNIERKYRELPYAQRLYYNKQSLDTEINTINEINKLFTEAIDTYQESPIKTLLLKYHVIIKKYINKIVYVHEIEKALRSEILFYDEMAIIRQKIDRSHTKFLSFCERYPGVFGRGADIRKVLIDIMTSGENFVTRFTVDSSGVAMGLYSAISDLYAILRMFTIFDDNKKGPVKCADIHTPKHVVVYAGQAHTALYESVFAYYDFRNVLQIYRNVKDEPLYKERSVLGRKITYLIKDLVRIKRESYKTSATEIDLYGSEIKDRYDDTIEKLSTYKTALEEKQRQIDTILSKMLYSDRSVNLMNSGKTVNHLITDFLND
jgi:hypothetical protein